MILTNVLYCIIAIIITSYLDTCYEVYSEAELLYCVWWDAAYTDHTVVLSALCYAAVCWWSSLMDTNSKQLDELLKSELGVCQKAGLTDDGGERHMKQSESSNGQQQTPSPHNHNSPIIHQSFHEQCDGPLCNIRSTHITHRDSHLHKNVIFSPTFSV